ncbi:hypothetical protein PVAP13_4KG057900 [Panicum virgatum]|uniref:Uncharacterized protein n=1 Tax=Panicum virgatum TaxID=38727 RepID=A0A8T0TB02_PANVG|nr:hypothetical protein PVAP13_4KG057900 [Panicum virgatum]
MRGHCYASPVFVMAIFLLIVLFASPAQSARQYLLSPTLPAAGSSTNTRAASDEGSKACDDLVFCSKTICGDLIHGVGSVDCYCCEIEYPNPPCFRTMGACLAKCRPLCNNYSSPSPRHA